MAGAYVQKTQAGNGTVTLTGVGAGSLLVICAAYYSATSITIDHLTGNSNAYVQCAGALKARTNMNTDIWYVQSANTGSTGVGVVWAGGSPACFALHIFEFTGQHASAFDAGNSTEDPGSTNTTTNGTVTTLTDNCILVSIINHNGGASPTEPSGWLAQQNGSAGCNRDVSAGLADAGLTGAKNAYFTLDSAGNWSQSVAAFAIATGGGGGGSPLRRNSSLNGLGASGPFFHNPLGRHQQPDVREFVRRDRIFVPAHYGKAA